MEALSNGRPLVMTDQLSCQTEKRFLELPKLEICELYTVASGRSIVPCHSTPCHSLNRVH